MKEIYVPKYFRQMDFDIDCGVTTTETQFDHYVEHGHDFYEMEYITEGEMDTLINGVRFHVKQGDLVFLTPLDVHSYEKNSDGSMMKVTVLRFDSSMTSRVPELAEGRANILSKGHLLDFYIRQLVSESTNHDQYSRDIINNISEIIIMKYFRLVHQKNTNCSFNKRPDDISAVIGYIYKNFREPITLENLSSFAGYSSPYLCRKFHNATGEHLTDFINNVRLEYALNLIRCKNISITNVCFESGFGSMRNFREYFSRKLGCSPSEYKKKIWSND